MKILFYINAIHHGGAERVMCNLATQFSEHGDDCILTTSFRDNWEYPFGENVRRITLFESQLNCVFLRRNISLIRKLRKILKTEKPDIIVSFMAEPNFRTLIAARGLNVKTIVSVRNDPNKEYPNFIYRFLAKHLYKKADGIVFQTAEAKKWFPKKLQKKSAVIMNETTEEFYDMEYVGGNDIVTLGRLVKQKNQKLLIEAFASIADQYPDTNLKIYGEGPLKTELLEFIEKLNMADRIYLMGSTKDVGEVLSTSKIFVLSSDYEGMPNALLEALTVGVPSIATDCPCGGPRDLIENGVNGLLVRQNNREEMIFALKKMLDNEEAAKLMGRKAKERAKNYHPDIIFSEWKNYVERIICS